jgi:signal transduction histidine kinase
VFKLKDISIKRKLFLGFFIIVLLSAFFVLTAYPLLYKLKRYSVGVIPLVESIISIKEDVDSVEALEAATDLYILSNTSRNRLRVINERDIFLSQNNMQREYWCRCGISIQDSLSDYLTELNDSIDKMIEARESQQSTYSINQQAITTYRLLDNIERLLTHEQEHREAHLKNNIQHHNSIIRYLLWGFYIAGSLIILISVVLAYYITRFIAKGLSALQDATNKIANGQFDVRMPVDSDDEIGQLAQSFNEMANQLEHRTTSVDSLNKEIEQRQKVETQLLQLNEDLGTVVKRMNESNRELQHLTHVASHDLREPLRKMCCFGGLLSETAADKLDDDERENLWFVVDAAQKMLERIEAIQAYSNIISQRYASHKVNLDKIIKELMQDEFAETIAEKKAVITVSENLPELLGSTSQIRLLMEHLLNNALEYHKKDAKPEIAIRYKQKPDGMARIEVEDNGIGIKKDDFDKVFAMFGRLHLQEKFEGAGVGLALCRKIVERHGGDMGVSSEYGKGSTFWFTMPTSEVSAQREKQFAESGSQTQQ